NKREVHIVPKGNPGGNPDILRAAAEAKKKEALEKTEKAIAELVKSGSQITFKSVAEKAGVSVPYLYKYDELKQRIQYLRNQQKQQPKKRKPKPQSFQPASDQSKAVLIYNLREDNKRLRGEIEKQRKHIEVVQGKLYELSLVAEENQRLKQQLEKVTLELNSTKAELDRYLLSNPTAHPKVTSINAKKNISNEIKPDTSDVITKISALGIRMNKKLHELIEQKSEQVVTDAISAVEEYLDSDKKVKSKTGLLRTALEDEWKPNSTTQERKAERANDDFSEWFNLAREQGIVIASQRSKDGIIVLESTGKWTLFTEMVEKGYTLESLRDRN
ncbi:MAG: DUF6262 family protein, partial [Xenococcus sp. (in: cyanobacteria)]